MDRTTVGWINGFLGMLVFSGSMPATRLAVTAFDPLFLTAVRAGIAGLCGGVLLILFRAALPATGDLPSLLAVGAGVVVGFPLLSALALGHISAGQSILFTGLLPLATALFGVMRGGERPRAAFWLFSIAGAALVTGFAATRGAEGSVAGNLLMLAAVVVCGWGYAEGAALSRRLGGWQVISWALVVALPAMAAVAAATRPEAIAAGPAAWAALGYVSLFSMLIGFVFWYRGLALGGIAGVGQLQLLQPFFGLLLAALVLGEAVTPAMFAVASAVVACVAGARRFA